MKSMFITEKLLKTIFTNMRVFRNMLGLSQEEFGKMAGLKQSEYSKIESGQKDNWAKHWDDIANAFGINPLQLLIEDAQVALINKQLVINGLSKTEFERDNPAFFLFHLLNNKQQRLMDDCHKQLVKVTRKWKSVESKLMKSNKIIAQKNEAIEKLMDDVSKLRISNKIKGGNFIMINSTFTGWCLHQTAPY